MRLGIDTGGTFTDAALVDSDGAIVATAKAPTVHDDLIVGVAGALDRVLASVAGAIHPTEISSVALSTTLATNAMVERTGGGAALVLIGFDDASLARVGGLDRATHVVRIAGGHNAHGREVAELGRDELTAALDDLAHTEAIAVSSMFAVRNDDHEVSVRSMLAADPRTATVPVTCSHELSGRLDGPRRAATSLANAVLTGPISKLLSAFSEAVRAAGVEAPLVVVRSDGSVMSLTQALERPVETILSGPAASLVGGIHLAGVNDAVVVDIGGTTTDVAVVSNAIPEVVDDGATVGGVGTMIRSPRITTEGLGGDSEVAWHEQDCHLTLGPGRVVPLGIAQTRFPEIMDRLRSQMGRRLVTETDGLFCVTSDGSLVEATGAFSTRRDYLAARRSAAAGELRFVALTPTDAAWALGRVDVEGFGIPFDSAASQAGLELFAAKLNRYGEHRFPSGTAAAESVVSAVERTTGSVIARAIGLPERVWAETRPSDSIFRVAVTLDRPIVGIGASAGLYHPPLSELLGTDVIVPPSSEVANAVGAAVGSVRAQLTASITAPKRAGYVLHRPGQNVAFETLEEAVEEGERRLRDYLLGRHESSGLAAVSGLPTVKVQRRDNVVHIDGADFFVECILEATLTHPVGT